MISCLSTVVPAGVGGRAGAPGTATAGGLRSPHRHNALVADATWYSGNAADDGRANRGWFVGHFIDPAQGIRHSKDMEVKWSTHKAGEKRAEWAPGDRRATLVLLIAGEFRVDLADASITLSRPGDYVFWGPGTGHSWEVLSDTTVVTIRWPSSP